MYRKISFLLAIALVFVSFVGCSSAPDISDKNMEESESTTQPAPEPTLAPTPEPTPEPTPLPILTANELFAVSSYGLVKLYDNGEYGTRDTDFNRTFEDCNGILPESFRPVSSSWSYLGTGLIYDTNEGAGKLLLDLWSSLDDREADESVVVELKSTDYYPNKNVVDVGIGEAHFIALFDDGSVSAKLLENTPSNYDFGQTAIDEIDDAIAVDAGHDHTLILKQDGTVKAYGNNNYNQCEVSKWTDIIAIAADDDLSVGLKNDGTVVFTNPGKAGYGYNYLNAEQIESWEGIVKIAVSSKNDPVIFGLKNDGTIVASGNYHKIYSDKMTAIGWSSEPFGQDIIDIVVSPYEVFGLDKAGHLHTYDRHNHYLFTAPWRSGVSDICEYIDIDLLVGRKTDHLATWNPENEDTVEDMDTLWNKAIEISDSIDEKEFPKVSLVDKNTILVEDRNEEKGTFTTESSCVNVQISYGRIYCLLEGGDLLTISDSGDFENGEYSVNSTTVYENFVDMDEYVAMVGYADDLAILYKSGLVQSFKESSDAYKDYDKTNWDRWKETYPDESNNTLE